MYVTCSTTMYITCSTTPVMAMASNNSNNCLNNSSDGVNAGDKEHS